MSGEVTITPLQGSSLTEALDDLARLRICVFSDWPYLYDGDLDYERRYLSELAAASSGIIVAAQVAQAGRTRIIGAATGAMMPQVQAAFQAPFAAQGADLSEIFYCAESVLLPDYRGRGIGHAFFEHREAHARAMGARRSVFCAVIRPEDHPARPADYAPLDPFWRKRGYERLEDMRTTLDWLDHGESAERAHPMQFWGRAL
ncbi:MAG: GNAT family N-acetyltransferase [Neomegalonema sp.]|nr:GNAT family N-acetyltransferase [Neomegalonema sp.]